MIQHVALIAEDNTCYNYTSLQKNLNSIYTSLLKEFAGKLEEKQLKAEKEYIDETFYEVTCRNINVSHFELRNDVLLGWTDVAGCPRRSWTVQMLTAGFR